MNVSRHTLLLGVVALVAFALLAVGATIGSGLMVRLITVLGLVFAAVPMLLAVTGRARELRPHDMVWIFAVGVVIRLFFFLPEPYLSDDLYRYLWDGRVQLSGEGPYGVAPSEAALDAVEENTAPSARLRHLVNHPHIPTIYPPVLELVFAGSAVLDRIGGALFSAWSVFGAVTVWRLILLGFEIGMAACLLGALRRRGLDPRWLVLYWWHPLPVAETIWSAHAEGIAITMLVAAWSALESERWRRGAIVWGLAGAAKLLPFVFGFLVWRRAGFRWLLVAAGVALVSALPYVAGRPPFEGLTEYAESWYYNDILFHPLGALLGIDVEDRTLTSTQWLRKGLVIAFLAITTAVTLRARDLYHAGLVVTAAFVLLTPTLHPWYVLWLLPFAVVRGSLPGIVFSITVLFAHVATVRGYELQLWGDAPWAVKVAEFAPPLVVLLWQVWARQLGPRLRKRPAPASPPAP